MASIHANEVTVAIIPHTYAATSLRTVAPGSKLNIEVDVLSKYAQKQSQQETTHPELTVELPHGQRILTPINM